MLQLKHKLKGETLLAREYNAIVDAINSLSKTVATSPVKLRGEAGVVVQGLNVGPVGATGLITKYQPVLITDTEYVTEPANWLKWSTTGDKRFIYGFGTPSIKVTRSQSGNDLTRFGIALDTIMVGFVGPVLISGITWAWVDCGDTSLKKASITSAYTDRMVLVSSGGVADVQRLLPIYADGVPTEYAALITFPVGGGGTTTTEELEAHSHSTTKYGYINPYTGLY